MVRILRRRFSTFAAFGVVLLLAPAVLAQGNGDYDGDGDVDGDDFANWDACMAGPGGGLPKPECSAFDFDGDDDVGLEDFRPFQVAFTGPASPCTFGKKYADVTKPASATGCSAKIRTRSTMLCGEPSANTLAASAAWTGVTKYQGGTPVKWAQLGYARYRARTGPSTTVFYKRYAETKWGPGGNDVDFHTDTPPSAGAHEYKCYLISSLFGTWKYDYDGLPWYQFTHSNWVNVTGTHYSYETEIFNKEDQMVGTATAKCNYTECKYSVNWGAFQNANITTGDLHTDDPTEWGIERVSSTAINVWDIIP